MSPQQQRKSNEVLTQKPCIIWFSGPDTIANLILANSLEKRLIEKGLKTFLLNRNDFKDLKNSYSIYSDKDKIKYMNNILNLSKIISNSGLILITTFISPSKENTELARKLVNKEEFIEIFVDTTFEVEKQKNHNSLLQSPNSPELTLTNNKRNEHDNINKILEYLHKRFSKINTK